MGCREFPYGWVFDGLEYTWAAYKRVFLKSRRVAVRLQAGSRFRVGLGRTALDLEVCFILAQLVLIAKRVLVPPGR